MEEIIHYVWKFRLFQRELKTTDGLPIEVIDVGLSNANEGPDFFNAKVRIGDKLWAGNIEIHTRASEWKRHRHHTNKAYNSVILHVVEDADCEVYSQLGQAIPQCTIAYPAHIKENYDFLVHSNTDLACANFMASIPPIHITGWMHNLLVERLERKSNDVAALCATYNNSWEEVFYVLLSRNLGFGLNSDSFERLAKSLPLKYIQKQRDNIIQIEALLFGQAGMLDNVGQMDDYTHLLQKEYAFLANKYELQPLSTILFNKLRVRPSAFPQIRVAQLASLLQSTQALFSKITTIRDLGQLRLLFHINASEYWQTHYQLGIQSERKSKYIGDSSLDIILINTVIPILFSYGKSIGNEEHCEQALLFLEEIKAERNSITKQFESCGLPLASAADSQAIIQLKREYCEKKKCLYCRIGHRLLTEK